MGVEQISLNLAKRLGNKLDKNEEEIAVLNYGLFFLIHTSIAILLTLLVGIVLGIFTEIMIISISASLLKRYSGGVHSSSPNRCVMSGLILSVIASFISKYIAINFDYINMVLFEVIIMIVSAVIFYKKCPVPSKNKPLKKESTRIKLRKKAFQMMFLYTIIIIVLCTVYSFKQIYWMKLVSFSIVMGIIIQTIAITKLGDLLINFFEKIFDFVKFN